MNQELVKYIENEIFPLYSRNEEGHVLVNLRKALDNQEEFIKRIKKVITR